LDHFQVPDGQQRFEIEIKRSKFITTVDFVDDKFAAKHFIASVRHSFPDANHHCWAMLAGSPSDLFQQDQSDDGEPKGTAGKPMLNVLQHSGLGHIAVVVTRYFGGIKLGAGGLVRAYTQSVSSAVTQLNTNTHFIHFSWFVDVPYSLYNSLEHKLSESTVQIGEKRFEELVHLELLVPLSEEANLERLLAELGNGDIVFRRGNDTAGS